MKSFCSSDAEWCCNLSWNKLKTFIELYGFYFFLKAVQHALKQSVKRFLSKISLKVSKAGNTYGTIQDREEARSQACRFGMSVLYNIGRKEKRSNVPYPPKMTVSKMWKQFSRPCYLPTFYRRYLWSYQLCDCVIRKHITLLTSSASIVFVKQKHAKDVFDCKLILWEISQNSAVRPTNGKIMLEYFFFFC